METDFQEDRDLLEKFGGSSALESVQRAGSLGGFSCFRANIRMRENLGVGLSPEELDRIAEALENTGKLELAALCLDRLLAACTAELRAADRVYEKTWGTQSRWTRETADQRGEEGTYHTWLNVCLRKKIAYLKEKGEVLAKRQLTNG